MGTLEGGLDNVQVTWKTEGKLCLPNFLNEAKTKKDQSTCISINQEKQAENQRTDGRLKCDELVAVLEKNFEYGDTDVKFDGDSEQKDSVVPEALVEGKPNVVQKQLENNGGISLDGFQSVMNGDSDTEVCRNVGDGVDNVEGLSVVLNKTDGELSEEKFPSQEGDEMKENVQLNEKIIGISSTDIQAMFGVSCNTYPKEKTELIKLREDLAMELLWIQQAIESRKNYLVMKQNLKENKEL